MTAPQLPAGPVIGAALWQQVIYLAGERCECRTQCGRKHKDGQGRCTQSHIPGRPLHAVPRDDIPFPASAALPAAGLHALCPACHASVDTARAGARAADLARASAPDPLF